LITFVDKSFLVSSSENGKLTITAVADTMGALKTASLRVTLTAAALKAAEEVGEGWEEVAMNSQALKLQGDYGQLSSLDDKIEPYLDRAISNASNAGPSHAEITYAEEQTETLAVAAAPTFEIQPASVAWDAAEPLLQKIRGWIMFSAFSNMTGNMGQSNYGAANTFLNVLTEVQRITNPTFDPINLGWGAVTGLGMRWKAFASQDFLLTADNSDEILMTPAHAQEVLKYVVGGLAPEWIVVNKFDKANMELMLAPTFRYNPLDAAKGKGGGLSFDGSVQEGEDVAGRQAEKSSGSPLYPGRRIKVHSLTQLQNLNESKGTLLEEEQQGLWRVKLDDVQEEKLLRTKNIKTLTGEVIEKAAPPAVESYCLAGTWSSWMPQDMEWDQQQECLTCEVELDPLDDGVFAVNRGKAMGKAWKSRPKQVWTIGKSGGRFQIRLFLKDGRTIKKVDWVRA